MDIVLEHPRTVNMPVAPDAYRAWVENLTQREYAVAFGVCSGAKAFICPTTGRSYIDAHPTEQNTVIWTRCRHCDAALHIRGEHADYDHRNPQRHCYPILDTEHDHAAAQALGV